MKQKCHFLWFSRSTDTSMYKRLRATLVVCVRYLTWGVVGFPKVGAEADRHTPSKSRLTYS